LSKRVAGSPTRRYQKGQVIYARAGCSPPRNTAAAGFTTERNIVSLGYVTSLTIRSAADPRSAGFKSIRWLPEAAGGKLIRYGAKLFLTADGFHAASGRQWLDDRRRLRQLPQLAVPQGHSPGHQERASPLKLRFALLRTITAHACNTKKVLTPAGSKTSWEVRNFHQGLRTGWSPACSHGLQQLTGGRGLVMFIPRTPATHA
jgi:hypothetical protein